MTSRTPAAVADAAARLHGRPGPVLHFADEAPLARALAAELGVPAWSIGCHRFPDGEFRLTLPPALPAAALLLRGLHQPNEKLAQLLLLAPALREAGVDRLTLIAPYLAYMRQDIAFNRGEVVSQRHLGRTLATWFDAVLTVDPHLHRVASMAEVVPGRKGVAVSAAGAIGAWIAAREPTALLLGPDEESAQWVRVAADSGGLGHAVCRKIRRGDHEVEIELPPDALQGRVVVLVDDVASTGRTLAAATAAVLARGAARVDVAVTHALFVGDAEEVIRRAGAGRIWSTDTVPHASNVIAIAPLLAQGLATAASSGPWPAVRAMVAAAPPPT